MGRPRDGNDRVAWLLQRRRYADALAVAEEDYTGVPGGRLFVLLCCPFLPGGLVCTSVGWRWYNECCCCSHGGVALGALLPATALPARPRVRSTGRPKGVCGRRVPAVPHRRGAVGGGRAPLPARAEGAGGGHGGVQTPKVRFRRGSPGRQHTWLNGTSVPGAGVCPFAAHPALKSALRAASPGLAPKPHQSHLLCRPTRWPGSAGPSPLPRPASWRHWRPCCPHMNPS